MNRRGFMRLLAAAAVAPAIGLPTSAEAAPAIIKVPWIYYSMAYRHVYYGGRRIILAGTAMCYADDGCRVVKSAWETGE